MPDTATTTEIAQYIRGARASGTSTRTQPVYNPATGAVARQVRLGNAGDVNAAVAAACDEVLVVMAGKVQQW